MQKLLFCALLYVLCVSISFGQQVVTDDYHKFEVFAGYSNNQVDVSVVTNNISLANSFIDDREGFNGFNASFVGNFNRYVGIKGDVSGHYKTFRFAPPIPNVFQSQPVETGASLYNFLGGVQVKDNRKEGSRLRPFGHAMAGVARGKIDFERSVCIQVVGSFCPPILNEPAYGFAAAVGGGVDIKATERFSVRAIQLDYNPSFFGNTTQHNFRFGVGVVFH